MKPFILSNQTKNILFFLTRLIYLKKKEVKISMNRFNKELSGEAV